MPRLGGDAGSKGSAARAPGAPAQRPPHSPARFPAGPRIPLEDPALSPHSWCPEAPKALPRRPQPETRKSQSSGRKPVSIPVQAQVQAKPPAGPGRETGWEEASAPGDPHKDPDPAPEDTSRTLQPWPPRDPSASLAVGGHMHPGRRERSGDFLRHSLGWQRPAAPGRRALRRPGQEACPPWPGPPAADRWYREASRAAWALSACPHAGTTGLAARTACVSRG